MENSGDGGNKRWEISVEVSQESMFPNDAGLLPADSSIRRKRLVLAVAYAYKDNKPQEYHHIWLPRLGEAG